jgi:hypothetical protein
VHDYYHAEPSVYSKVGNQCVLCFEAFYSLIELTC